LSPKISYSHYYEKGWGDGAPSPRKKQKPGGKGGKLRIYQHWRRNNSLLEKIKKKKTETAWFVRPKKMGLFLETEGTLADLIKKGGRPACQHLDSQDKEKQTGLSMKKKSAERKSRLLGGTRPLSKKKGGNESVQKKKKKRLKGVS